MVANQLVTTGPQLVPDQDSETVCANGKNHRQTLSVNPEKVQSKSPGEFSQRSVCGLMYKTSLDGA